MPRPARGRDDRSPQGDPTQRMPRPPRRDEQGHDAYDDRYDDPRQRYDDRRQGYDAYDDRYDDRRQGYDPYDERYDDRRQGYDLYDERYDDRRQGYDPYDERYDERRAPSGPPPRRRTAPAPRRRRRRPRYGFRRFLALLALLVVAYVVTMIVVLSLVWGSVNRVDATPDVADRPGGAAGSTFLLVGTDSREQLTEDQRDDFGTGFTEGSRADTVMLLHVPTLGSPTLVSLPRDSYVDIRDHGWDKLNAAHSRGGPELLTDTVERATGMRVDGYLEIGFGGFVTVVDGVGGVEMCLDEPIQDDKAHLDLPAGCQVLDGASALGYVRMRYSDPRGDIGRVERQREFLGALVQELATPATVLNPWRLHQVGTATGGALALGDDTSLIEAGRLALAMRSVANGSGTSVTVPVAQANFASPVGSAVLWNEEGAAALFTALRNGQAVTVPTP